MELRHTKNDELALVMEIINGAKAHLKSQNIDQWQAGYPDENSILEDIAKDRGYFVQDNGVILAYLCIDFAGEPAYDGIEGTWLMDAPYVVVHRLAFHENSRGKKLADTVFALVEKLSLSRGVKYFRIDTDEDNSQMRHILGKNGFSHRGTINFDNSIKWAFDKKISL